MRILILGGTVFLGRALTDAALARRHDVTHVNRGLSSPPDARVATIGADRASPAFAAALAGERWDAVIDTSGYLPQVVAASARALAGSGRYLFVSSISVYAGEGYGEEAPVQPPPDPLPGAWTPETYGALKAACEAEVRSAFGDRASIVRPGLIVGPHDPTDRFTWWPARVARGGRVAAPGRPERTVQFIDVRDLAAWMIAALEAGVGGTCNATGPARPVSMRALLETCRAVSRAEAELVWVDEALLAAQGVAPWKDMPLWIPESDPHAAGFMDVPIERALATGLAFRPLAETVADTLRWAAAERPDRPWKAGLEARREEDLLRANDAALFPAAP
jgi:nucleoside-diphosphate-sugar epimerase